MWRGGSRVKGRARWNNQAVEGDRDLCRGWTTNDVRRLYEEASDNQRRLLEVMARRGIASRTDLIESLDAPKPTSIDGYLGNLGKLAYKLDIKDADGNVTWPFYINRWARTDEHFYLMPKQVAEVILPGARKDAEPWEL
jgi:hypothetical protein